MTTRDYLDYHFKDDLSALIERTKEMDMGVPIKAIKSKIITAATRDGITLDDADKFDFEKEATTLWEEYDS